MPSREYLIRNHKDLTEEGLVLVGYGCNMDKCQWTIFATDTPVFKALAALGKHNNTVHGGKSEVHIERIYRRT